jgi:hypothetical protein
MRNLLLGSLLAVMVTPALAGEVDGYGCPLSAPSGAAEASSLFACVPDGSSPTDGEVTAPPVIAAGTDLAYNKDFWNSRWGHHQLANFPGFSTDATGVFGSVYATDFDPAATTLYALNSDTLSWGTMNLATGAFSSIGSSVPSAPGHNLWSGLAIHPVTGVVYASGIAGNVNMAYGLYAIDPATGAATLLGQDATSMAMIALAINCSGELFGHDIITDSVYRIDPANGAVTLVGPTGVNSNFAQGMDFDNDTQQLYAWTYQGGGANRYGTIDPATGALNILSTTNPIGEFEGAVKNSCSTLFNNGFELFGTAAWSAVTP